MKEPKIVKVFGIVMALGENGFMYLSEIPGGDVEKYETLLTSLSRHFEEKGIDIGEIQPTFLCFREKPGDIDFYYALPVDSESMHEFIREEGKDGLCITERLEDKELENEILRKIIKRDRN